MKIVLENGAGSIVRNLRRLPLWLGVLLISVQTAQADMDPGKGGDIGGLPQGFTSVGDLNGDNRPELMETIEEYSGEFGSIKRTIFTWSAADKKFVPTRVVAQTKTSGGCNYDNIVENISFDVAAKHFPAVLISRKYRKSDEKCSERVVMERTDSYQWNTVFMDYVTLLSNVGGGEEAAVRRASAPSEELPVQKIVLARDGAVRELNKSFDVKTVISGFEKKESLCTSRLRTTNGKATMPGSHRMERSTSWRRARKRERRFIQNRMK